jgi:hypothetical protein
MQYDFWNNPLVVSAMRLKYRRSSPGITTCLYLLVLLTIGGMLRYYQDSYSLPPGRAFLLAILALQFVVSGGIALFTVANSVQSEVANRTLDFQRAASSSIAVDGSGTITEMSSMVTSTPTMANEVMGPRKVKTPVSLVTPKAKTE